MTSHNREASSDDKIDLNETVLRVQREVRQEFITWNLKHVKEVLERDVWRPVSEPSTSRSKDIDAILGISTDEDSDGMEDETRPSWLAPGAPVDVQYDVSDWDFDPSPEYEYCAPVDRNRYVGDDSSALIFDPLTEKTDPEKHEDFLDLHDDLAWTTLADPADEFISLETAARLQERYGLTLREIHDADILDPPLFDHKSICGVFGHGRNRDYPQWDRPSPARIFDRPENQATRTTVPRCPYRECMSAFPCTLHDPKSSKQITTHSSRPVLDLQTLRKENRPCGPDCGLLESASLAVLEYWPDSDMELLRDALTQQPTMLPCTYAAMWGVRCVDVFALRTELLLDIYPDLVTHNPQTTMKRRNTKRKKPITDLRRAPHGPCAHDGPCTSNVCACYKVSGFCQSDCKCAKHCDRRWRGCTCSKAQGVACNKKTCKCLAANRECDPVVCGKCGAGDVNEHTCANVSLQRRIWKKIEVRQSTWGYGAFVLEPVKKGELVIEYIGEVIAQPTVDSREYVALERGRHYLYNLNEVFTLDATYASNAARYINHDSRNANCQALMRLVGGEHRIALVAGRNIDVDEELFLDYGKEFPIPGENAE